MFTKIGIFTGRRGIGVFLNNLFAGQQKIESFNLLTEDGDMLYTEDNFSIDWGI